jgi:hypothetical protein
MIPNLHVLKTWPDVFTVAASGLKSFEYRKDDCGFQVADVLKLAEYDPKAKAFTGRAVFAKVVYILRGGRFGIPAEYCIMGLEYSTRRGQGNEHDKLQSGEATGNDSPQSKDKKGNQVEG